MSILETINELGKKAKDASIKIRVLHKEKKKVAYEHLEKNIKDKASIILSANKLDIENAISNNLSKPLINRLKVTDESISDIIKSKDSGPKGMLSISDTIKLEFGIFSLHSSNIFSARSKQVIFDVGNLDSNNLAKYPVPLPKSKIFDGLNFNKSNLSIILLPTSLWATEYSSYEDAFVLKACLILFL